MTDGDLWSAKQHHWKAEAKEDVANRSAEAIVFFIFCFTDFFRNKLVSEDEIKIKIKINSDHFPIELKSKETQLCFLRF